MTLRNGDVKPTTPRYGHPTPWTINYRISGSAVIEATNGRTIGAYKDHDAARLIVRRVNAGEIADALVAAVEEWDRVCRVQHKARFAARAVAKAYREASK